MENAGLSSRPQSQQSAASVVLPTIVLLAIMFLLVGCGGNEENASTNGQNGVVEGVEEVSVKEYQDGEYLQTGNYISPAGKEEVDVAVTLEDGVIVAVKFTGKTTNETSKKLQGQFSEGFEAEVMGKQIDEVDLDVVNGSPLTPDGFMDALEKIKVAAGAK